MTSRRRRVCLECVMLVCAGGLVAGAAPPRAPDAGAPARLWVYFADKGLEPEERERTLAALPATYNQRAVERRRLRRTAPGLFDDRDLPVAPAYLSAVEGMGARVHTVSRWLNAAGVSATPAQREALRSLAHVTRVEPVRAGRRATPPAPAPMSAPQTRGFYGYAEAQLSQINLIGLHALGFTGQGVVVGILDTGFRRTHPVFNHPGHALQVVAEKDFINNDLNTGIEPGDHPDQHVHGTLILSVLGGYRPDEFVGGAFDASFILCKTEDITSETPVEEDNYVAGLEFIEQNGGDVATSSLGYIDWYTQADLDGATATTTIAVNIATENGLFCCTAAGNSGHDANPATSSLIAPADALQVITCGAADSAGAIAGFSSDGPSADGRLKPEALARGVETACVWPYDDSGYAAASGTSLSTPVVACAVACLAGARPSWSVDRMRAYLFATAGDQAANGQPDPLFVRGHGILNALAAYTTGCPADYNGDLFVDGIDYDAFNNDFASFDPAQQMNADYNGDGFVDGIDYDQFNNDFESGC